MTNNTEYTDNRTSVTFIGREIHTAARAIFTMMGSVMIVIGVIGNSLLIAVIFKRFVRKRFVHHLFLSNLALADILTLGYWFTFFVLNLILGYHPVANNTHCIANGMIICTLAMVSMTSLLSISLNRYLHVCHSRFYNRLFTLPRTICWCLFTWLFGFVAALPPVWGNAGSYTHICIFSRRRISYPKIMVILFTVIPMLLIGYWNFAIFRFWKKEKMSLTSRYGLAAEDEKKKKKKVTVRWRVHQTNGTDDVGTQHGNEVREERFQFETPGDVSQIEEEEEESPGFTTDENEIQSTDFLAEESPSVTETKDVPAAKPENQFCNENDRAKNVEKDEDTCGAIVMTLSGSSNRDFLREQIEDCKESADMDTVESTMKEENLDAKLTKLDSHHLNKETTEPVSQHRDGEIQKDPAVTSPVRPVVPTPLPPGLQNPHTNLATQSLQLRLKKERTREIAFVRSLFVAFIAMFICFIPLAIVAVVGAYVFLPDEVAIGINMLSLLNNAVNWIVYGVMNKTFRKGYVKCVRQVLSTCCRVGKERAERNLNMTTEIDSNSP